MTRLQAIVLGLMAIGIAVLLKKFGVDPQDPVTTQNTTIVLAFALGIGGAICVALQFFEIGAQLHDRFTAKREH